MVREQNSASGGSGGDIDALGDKQIGAVLKQGLQRACSLVELAAAGLVASEDDDSDPFGDGLVN